MFPMSSTMDLKKRLEVCRNKHVGEGRAACERSGGGRLTSKNRKENLRYGNERKGFRRRWNRGEGERGTGYALCTAGR